MPKTEDEAKTNSPTRSAEAPASTDGGADKTAAAPQSPPTSAQAAQPADAIALLKQDHRAVDALFSRYEGAADREKPNLIKQICADLTVHTLLEEEIFYPACKQAAGEDQLDEAQVEHDSAKVLIIDLSENGEDEYRDAKVKVLTEQIRTHIREEEAADGIFAKAQKAGVNTADLAQRLSRRKQALMEQVKRGTPPPTRTVSFRHPITDNPNQEENMRQASNGRDERGRFTGDDDRSSGRSRASRSEGSGRSRNDDDDDRRYSSRSSSGRYDDDDDRRPGWRGDPEGHSEAARRGWEERRSFGRSSRDDDDDRRYSSRGRDDDDRYRGRDEEGRFTSRGRDDDDDRGGRSSGGRGRGGWFGDSEGHSEAARRGAAERSGGSSSRYRDDDDDYRRSSSRSRDEEGRFTSRGRDDDDDRRGRSSGDRDRGGWFGDSEGHSEAARRGWEERGGGSSRARSRDDDDDDRRSSRSSGGRDRGGWFGDSEGHSEAARRGWEDRR